MTPLFFGPPDSPLFGWLHPAADSAEPLAVLLCAPLGHEDLATHRGQRRLACALAGAGLTTLRFDYAGWGDSADVDASADPVARWLQSIDAAAELLLQRSGAQRLALVGTRMGALLAAQAACTRDDVEALVGVLPVASGRAWLRECRLLAVSAASQARARPEIDMAASSVGSGAAASGHTEVGGLVFDAAGAAAVAALRWPGAGARPAAQALLIERDDLADSETAQTLRGLGVDTLCELQPGLDRLTLVAHSAQTPPALIERIVGWIGERAAALREPAPSASASASASASTNARVALPTAAAQALLNVGGVTIAERAVCIGAAPRLAGMLTAPVGALPDGTPAKPQRGVLLLSSGAERRVGPNRLWVAFARQRAAAGDVVLRLDLAGIGDSDARPGTHPVNLAKAVDRHNADDADVYDPHCVADIAAALAWLRAECGVGRCDVVGLCSGAYHAWRAALGGAEVSTVIAVNQVAFHWKTGMSLDPMAHAFGKLAVAANARQSLRDPLCWLKLLRGQVNVRVIAAALSARAADRGRRWVRSTARLAGLRLTDDLVAELSSVVRRGTRLCFVFAEGDPGQQLLKENAGRLLGQLLRRQQLQLQTIVAADHTFTRQQARGALYRALGPLLDATPLQQGAR